MAGFGDILKLMSRAQELKAAAEKMKEEFPNTVYSAASANGGVKVSVGGDFTVRDIEIAPEMLGDKTYLERELRDALNSAYGSARTAMQDKIREVTGALGIELPSF